MVTSTGRYRDCTATKQLEKHFFPSLNTAKVLSLSTKEPDQNKALHKALPLVSPDGELFQATA